MRLGSFTVAARLLPGRAVWSDAAGSVGGAVARAFAREGAKVFLAGRTLATLEEMAEAIRTARGVAETAQVDALDEQAVDAHADVAVNAIVNDDVQGTPLAALPLEQTAQPIGKAMRHQFLAARAAARHMTSRGAG